MPTISIITPAYNRAQLLYRCFNSLKKQTSKDFEWIVVDDGSIDNTPGVVNSFQKQASGLFPITYIKKENGGKHTAINCSHSYIHGDYCFVLDSDDIIIPTAIEQILEAWREWDNDPNVGRIIFLKAFLSDPDQVICKVRNENKVVDTLKEERISFHGRDCCDTFRSSLFKKYKFPEFKGEKFIGEGAAWLPIELESKAVYINQAIYLCEYQTSGLTGGGRKLRIQNPYGGMYNSTMYMHPRLPLKTRIRKSMLYACYSRFAGLGFREAYDKNPYKILMIIGYLPGNCLYYYWKHTYGSD